MTPNKTPVFAQGTPEWLEWRLKGIGASETPLLFGHYDYGTPFKLWQEKTRVVTADGWAGREIFRMGHEVEDKMRATYEFMVGHEFKPECFEHPILTHLRASTDGWNDELGYGIEVKKVSAERFEKGYIKPEHMIQMQQQMLVTGAEKWIYLMSADGIHLKAIEVKADPEMQRDIANKTSWFWGLVESKTPPPYCDEDRIEDDNEEIKELLGCIRPLAASKKKADVEQVKFWREQVFTLMKHPRIVCGGVKVTNTDKVKKIEFPKETANASQDQGKADVSPDGEVPA